MYINFWYPIARSEDVVDDKPLRVELLGRPFVVFRDGAGVAHVLSDTCVHRGGSLSAGCVKDGHAICPYHGWEFGGDGTCKRIPSLAGAKPPARAKVDSYPVKERYDIVFAFLGDLPEEERPPLYDIEEYGKENWKTQLYVIDVKCNYERSMENGLDPIHNEFVHPSQGSPTLTAEQQCSRVPMEDIPWGSKFYVSFANRKRLNTGLEGVRSGARTGAVGSWFQGPNQLAIWIELSATNAFHQYFFEAPIDDSNTRIFMVNMRNWLLENEHDERVESATLNILREDVEILERLSPIRTPSIGKEILMPGDAVVVRYREWLADWDAKGWRIDHKKLPEQQRDIAFAIPSPGRRKGGNWVLDTTPLMAGADGARA